MNFLTLQNCNKGYTSLFEHGNDQLILFKPYGYRADTISQLTDQQKNTATILIIFQAKSFVF